MVTCPSVPTNPTEPARKLNPLTPQQWFNRPMGPQASWILLQKNHWIEVSFDRPIMDGAGDDIMIVEACCHGEQARITLIDDQDNDFLLGTLKIPNTDAHGIYTYGFDLNDVNLPFIPLRIETTKPGKSGLPNSPIGLELQQIRARVQKQTDRNP